MKPFEIQIKFSTPVVREGDYPIHLDGLLAYCVMKELEDFGSDDPWKESEDLSAYLAKTDESGPWCWKASRLEFTPLDRPFFQNSIRRCDPDLIYSGLERGQWEQTRKAPKFTVNTRSGQLRGYQRLICSQWVSAKAWGVGDIENLKSALIHLKYVGKESRNGFGRIENMEIREVGGESTDNWMRRIMPFKPESGLEFHPVMATIRPPYWRKTEAVEAFEPL